MSSLADILTRLQEELPGSDDVAEDDIGEMGWDIDEVLGVGVQLVSCDDGTSSSLPPALRSYFDALRYFQCINGMLWEVAGDGFLSVFYNGTGNDIDLLRSELKYFNDPLSPIVERAYALLDPVYRFEPGTNFAGRKGDCDVFEVVPEPTRESLAKLEEQVHALHVETYRKALALYRAAAQAL